jgi:hypothetical protein
MTKNFLKTLGAVLVAAGLTFAGVVAPAQAAPSFTGATTYSAGTGFASGVSFSSGANTTGNVTYIRIYANWNGSSTKSFNPLSTCSPSGATFAQCGLSQVQAGGTNYSSTGGGVTVKGLTNSGSNYNYIEIDFASPVSSGSPISVTFLANALSAPDVNGTYALTMTNGNGDTYTTNLTVTGARSSVMFYRNYNSSDMTISMQQASAPSALTANSFTQSGYNFCGWGNTRTGAVAYADGANFSFFSPNTPTDADQMTQLFAIWSATACAGGSSSGGSGSSGASTSSNTLANTGFNGMPYLATGAVLALAGAVIILFARRRYTS